MLRRAFYSHEAQTNCYQPNTMYGKSKQATGHVTASYNHSPFTVVHGASNDSNDTTLQMCRGMIAKRTSSDHAWHGIGAAPFRLPFHGLKRRRRLRGYSLADGISEFHHNVAFVGRARRTDKFSHVHFC
mmetsp:Transcript_7087/g.13985  ORF Transcript_7087/g.13985 Transcript_7087/m.13985 type:complete len:129 (-) Transcript_7087:85-471(-)